MEDDKPTTYEQLYKKMFKDVLYKVYDEPSRDGGGGRYFETPADLAREIINYFLFCHENGEMISVEGLCIYAGLWNRSALASYRNVKQYSEDFKTVVDRTISYIEKLFMERLFEPRSFNAARFVLQCRFADWVVTEKNIIENKDIIVNIGNKDEESSDNK